MAHPATRMGVAHTDISTLRDGNDPQPQGFTEFLKELASDLSWGGRPERESDGTESNVLVTSGVVRLGSPLPFLFPVTKEKHQLQN